MLAEVLETDQASISRKLAGEREFRFDEISTITKLILESTSPIPQKPISELYVSSKNTIVVFDVDTVNEAAKKMLDGGFTQLPVIDKNTRQCIGIITDFTLLKRMLSPDVGSKKGWLNDLKALKVRDANVIDDPPRFAPDSSYTEIAQALMYHYSVLVREGKRNTGIVTRADFLRLLLE
jgi:predicted transcriptional regulator